MPPISLPLPERIRFALEDYDLSVQRGSVTSGEDVLDVAVRWTVTDLDAPVSDVAAWADFDALRGAVYARHEQHQEAA